MNVRKQGKVLYLSFVKGFCSVRFNYTRAAILHTCILHYIYILYYILQYNIAYYNHGFLKRLIAKIKKSNQRNRFIKKLKNFNINSEVLKKVQTFLQFFLGFTAQNVQCGGKINKSPHGKCFRKTENAMLLNRFSHYFVHDSDLPISCGNLVKSL